VSYSFPDHSPSISSVVFSSAVVFACLISGAQAQTNWGAIGNLLGTTAKIAVISQNLKSANNFNEQGRQALAEGRPCQAMADFTTSLGYNNDPNVQGNLALAQNNCTPGGP
jgi:hypothetical protein